MSDIKTREAYLTSIAQCTIEKAKALGADHVEVDVSSAKGYSASVRMGDIDKIEYDSGKSLDVEVMLGQKRGSASTSDFSDEAIVQAVEAAYRFAKYAADDKYLSMPAKEELAFNYQPVEMCFPWDIEVSDAVEMAGTCEAHARSMKGITNSEGAEVSSHISTSVLANSLDFVGSLTQSSHDISCSLIAERDGAKERDGEYTSSCDPSLLWTPEYVAQRAAEKTLMRLGSRKVSTGVYPVLFHDGCAEAIMRLLASAIMGSKIYHKTSFLVDYLEKKIFPDNISVFEKPCIPRAVGSCPFDGEGVRTREKAIIDQGVLTTYLLSTYTGKQLGMPTTGNAGGVYNLCVEPTVQGGFEVLLKAMGTGLLITEMMGHGINLVTGDFSQGAAGFWVENGEIQYPVSEFTVAGNLKDMFMNIQAISDNVDLRRSIRMGSMLIDGMTVAG